MLNHSHAATNGALIFSQRSANHAAAAPHAHLTAAVWNWTDFYRNFIETVHRGEWSNGNYWYGLDSGLVGIAPFGKMVPQDVRDRVNAAQEDIKAGKLTVFAGPVRDQKGEVRVPEGQVAPDQDLLSMDWFVEGVIGTTE